METSKRICNYLKSLENIKKESVIYTRLKGSHDIAIELEKEYLKIKRIRNYIGFIRDTRK